MRGRIVPMACWGALLPALATAQASPAFDAEFGEDPTFPREQAERSDDEAPPPRDDEQEEDPTLEVVQDEDTHWLLSLGALITSPLEDEWDDALASRGYGDPSPSYGADLGVLYRATRWLNVGVRLAARHRYWLHWDRDAATLFGTDVLVSLDARWSPGRVFQVGLHASGGVAFQSTSINGSRKLDVIGRFQGGPLFTLKIYGTLRAMLRLAYDHAQGELAGIDANLGGFTFLLGFEVRE